MEDAMNCPACEFFEMVDADRKFDGGEFSGDHDYGQPPEHSENCATHQAEMKYQAKMEDAMEKTAEQVNRAREIDAAIAVARAVADAIRELRQVPSGVLYAHLMSRMTLDTYQGIIDSLVRAKVVRVEGHLITWIGR